jgi:hypothetical protein
MAGKFTFFLLLACAIIALIYLVLPYKIADDLTIMSTEIWGQLPKAQDNSDTIDDAIAAAIAAHDADSEAHLATGAVLGDHRENEALDHPAGSVWADKLTAHEIDITTNFESIDGWNTSGNVRVVLFPGVVISHDDGEGGGEGPASMYAVMSLTPYYFDFGKDTLFDVVLVEEAQVDDYRFFLGYFNYVSDTDLRGIGFKIVDNNIYGFVGRSGTLQLTSALGSGVYTSVKLRVVWNSTEKKAYFYLNGAEVATITDASASGEITSATPRFNLPQSAGEFAQFHISQLRIAKEL